MKWDGKKKLVFFFYWWHHHHLQLAAARAHYHSDLKLRISFIQFHFCSRYLNHTPRKFEKGLKLSITLKKIWLAIFIGKCLKLFHCECLQLAIFRLKFLKIDQCGIARLLHTRTSAQQIALYRREVVTLFRSFACFAYTLRTTDYSVVFLWRTLRQINVPICSTERDFFAIFLLRYFWTCAGNFKAWLDGCFGRTVGITLNLEGGMH